MAIETDGAQIEINEEIEEEAYVEYDIATYPSDYTLDSLQQMYDRNDIVVPPFQRKYVWNIQQASLLVESFLLGLPVPPLFLYVTDENKSEVIDGQQRLLSMMYFLEGYFGEGDKKGKRQIFRLTGLSDKSPFRGKRFSDLEEKFQRKLRSSVLRAINIRQLNPIKGNTSVFHIFERLNTGGTRLQPQEIRNVVFRGDIVDHLRSLNTLDAWRNIVGLDVEDKYQRDVELILRFLSLYRQWENYEKPMKEYLNKKMQEHRKFASKIDTEFELKLPSALQLIISALGRKPFRPKRVINTAILEAVVVSILENEDITVDKLRANYQVLLDNEGFQQTIQGATTDTKQVKDRLRIAAETLRQ